MTTYFHYFANPTRFQAFANKAVPIFLWAILPLVAAGLYGALWSAPADYLQGDAARIMYVHVPAAWMAMLAYAMMASFSFCYLIWRHAVADVLARSCALPGICFTALALITGMLWGKPSWGAAWVWDARLTSVLVLLLLFLGYALLLRAFDDPLQSSQAGAVLAVIGAVNLPVIKFSVDWWNTLHQPSSVLRLDGPTIHSSMLWPLLTMAAAYACLLIWAVLIGAQSGIAWRKYYIQQANSSHVPKDDI